MCQVQAMLAAPHGALGVGPLGDVVDRHADAVLAQRRDPHLHRPPGAQGRRRGQPPRLAVAHRGFQQPPEVGAAPCREQLPEVAPQDVPLGHAEEFLGRPVEQHHPPIAIHGVVDVADALQHRGQPGVGLGIWLGFLQRFPTPVRLRR
jgi:hypothetical protein